ncbi:type II secretion system F family protein [Ammoniphilus sp. YIM 78166]|uniref:type II secretion system F family protein n=1 Tax=Ammoniphilus sp. YIM 78166 TaxID=1644106 RepID=UPI00106F266A|nr:type II secretion system F family protein [Ammoniphilus sp. YIM 78166]
MPQFEYVGYNTERKKVKGKLEARDKKAAYQLLKDRGLYVTNINPFKQSFLTKDIAFLEPQIKKRDLAIFCRQFSTLLQASVGISESLQVLAQQTMNKSMKKALVAVLEDVRSGNSLSKACQSYPKVFPDMFISMVRAGEASGTLDDVLAKLASFFEKESIIYGKIRSALIYPVTVTFLSLGVGFFMMWKIVPNYVSMFQNMGLELPLITRIVMKMSEVITSFWYLFFLFPILLFVFIRIYSASKPGRYQMDYLKLKVPVFGTLFLKASLARFSRTFSTLFTAAVPIVQILSIVSHVVGNEVVSRSLEQAKENIKNGQPIVNPFRNSPIFPPMVVQMIAVGEKTGRLDTMLEKVADFYEDEVERMADNLRALIEPMMLIIVSGIVGLIVLAVLLPTLSMYKGFQ